VSNLRLFLQVRLSNAGSVSTAMPLEQNTPIMPSAATPYEAAEMRAEGAPSSLKHETVLQTGSGSGIATPAAAVSAGPEVPRPPVTLVVHCACPSRPLLAGANAKQRHPQRGKPPCHRLAGEPQAPLRCPPEPARRLGGRPAPPRRARDAWGSAWRGADRISPREYAPSWGVLRCWGGRGRGRRGADERRGAEGLGQGQAGAQAEQPAAGGAPRHPLLGVPTSNSPLVWAARLP
jgi:hypothetical protein